jgi:hypothetical protein
LPLLDRSVDSLYLLLIYLYFYITLIFSAYLSSIACSNNYANSRIYSLKSYMSTRRLIFTDDHMCFDCGPIACLESVDILWRDGESMGPRGHGEIFVKIPTSQWHLENYSGKELSYPSDVLNGFLGIFSTLRGHFQGLPVPPILWPSTR